MLCSVLGHVASLVILRNRNYILTAGGPDLAQVGAEYFLHNIVKKLEFVANINSLRAEIAGNPDPIFLHASNHL